MRQIYSVVSDFALISADGKPTVVGVFNMIRARSAPIQWARFVFANRVECDPSFEAGIHEILFTVHDPTGAQVAQAQGQITINAVPGVTRGTLDPHMVFDNFVFSSFGTYTFAIQIDGVPTGTAYIDVIQL